MTSPKDKLARNFIKWIFRYSGVEFIYRKFNPINPKTLPTGFIWIVGIYVAFFGVASQRYENRIDIIENRANSIFAQLAVTSVQKKALSRMSRVQNMSCPHKPKILNPFSVFLSLFGPNSKYEDMNEQLKETAEDWKDSLDSVNLIGAYLMDSNLAGANLCKADLREADLSGAYLMEADLSEADLREADLSGAYLMEANLYEADLRKANLREADFMEAELLRADLREADLSGAHLVEADLSGAGLIGADLSGADLSEADLSRATLRGAKNLTTNQLCKASTLYLAQLGEEIKNQTEEKCPELLQEP
jgi:uncharacterized protein YjbI with pentapeptide repeats